MGRAVLFPEIGCAAPVRVPTLIVIGGGTVGAVSVRQLLRACAAGRLETGRIRVVDRRADCEAARFGAPVTIEVAPWDDWLFAHLGRAGADDHLVPYHWAPHLLVDWLAAEVGRAGGRVEKGDPVAPRGLPFEAETRAGDRALSYASWTCPALCIEPLLCPHTRGPRDWSLATLLAAGETGVDHRIVFPSLHLVYGIGTIPVRAIHTARDRILSGLGAGHRSWLVSTASHCHGLARHLVVDPPAGGGSPTLD